jgi:hypothetical protein
MAVLRSGLRLFLGLIDLRILLSGNMVYTTYVVCLRAGAKTPLLWFPLLSNAPGWSFGGWKQRQTKSRASLATTEEGRANGQDQTAHLISLVALWSKGPRQSRPAGWEKFERLWWRCGLGVPGIIPWTALRGWTSFKLGCLMMLTSRFDMKGEQNQFLGFLGTAAGPADGETGGLGAKLPAA